MLHLLTNPFLQKAISIGFKKAVKYIDNKADLIVVERAQLAIEQEINKFILKIGARTKVYFLLSILNVASLLSLYHFKSLISIYIAGSVSLIFFSLFVYWSVKGFIDMLRYIENFENHLKELIKIEFKKAQEENWKNRLAVFLKSKGANEYYKLVLDQSVKSVSSWLSMNKRVLYIRLSAYFIASVSFGLSLREIILH